MLRGRFPVNIYISYHLTPKLKCDDMIHVHGARLTVIYIAGALLKLYDASLLIGYRVRHALICLSSSSIVPCLTYPACLGQTLLGSTNLSVLARECRSSTVSGFTVFCGFLAALIQLITDDISTA